MLHFNNHHLLVHYLIATLIHGTIVLLYKLLIYLSCWIFVLLCKWYFIFYLELSVFFCLQASEDAKKLVNQEKSFACAEIESARLVVQRIGEALEEEERNSPASKKQVSISCFEVIFTFNLPMFYENLIMSGA